MLRTIVQTLESTATLAARDLLPSSGLRVHLHSHVRKHRSIHTYVCMYMYIVFIKREIFK